MPTSSSYRAVIFDLFGTLIPPFPAERFHRSLDEMAAAVNTDADAFRHHWIAETLGDRTSGRFDTIAANVNHICKTLGVMPTEREVEEAVRMRNEFTRQVVQPRADAVSTLQSIREAGLGTGLVSDCSAEVPEHWPETALAPLIDVPVFSCRAGMGKPDPRIFMIACDGLGVEPQDCLYVGDGYSGELAGASSLGMTALLLHVPGEPSSSDHPGEKATWKGGRIVSLSEVLKHLAIG